MFHILGFFFCLPHALGPTGILFIRCPIIIIIIITVYYNSFFHVGLQKRIIILIIIIIIIGHRINKIPVGPRAWGKQKKNPKCGTCFVVVNFVSNGGEKTERERQRVRVRERTEFSCRNIYFFDFFSPVSFSLIYKYISAHTVSFKPYII